MPTLIQKLLEFGWDFESKNVLKKMLKTIGASEEHVDEIFIEFKNEIYRNDFKKAKKIFVFLPQCLRKSGCTARLTDEGYQCKSCSEDCQVNQIKKMAEEKGMKVFIVPGGSMVFKILEKEMPDAVLGIACHKELIIALEKGKEINLPGQCVPLLRDGCKDTIVDMKKVKDIINLKSV